MRGAIKMLYKCNETGKICTYAEVEKSHQEVVSNSLEFDEYIDSLDSFIHDYYVVLHDDLTEVKE